MGTMLGLAANEPLLTDESELEVSEDVLSAANGTEPVAVERKRVALRSDKGAVCEGQSQLDDRSTGSAVIVCTDGRTGTAELATHAGVETMKGMLGGLPFKGTFEDPSRPAAR